MTSQKKEGLRPTLCLSSSIPIPIHYSFSSCHSLYSQHYWQRQYIEHYGRPAVWESVKKTKEINFRCLKLAPSYIGMNLATKITSQKSGFETHTTFMLSSTSWGVLHSLHNHTTCLRTNKMFYTNQRSSDELILHLSFGSTSDLISPLTGNGLYNVCGQRTFFATTGWILWQLIGILLCLYLNLHVARSTTTGPAILPISLTQYLYFHAVLYWVLAFILQNFWRWLYQCNGIQKIKQSYLCVWLNTTPWEHMRGGGHSSTYSLLC
jgi:hypothetical protein